jgi:3,4-dihydroxy-2-butanone 4-phosphate synthase
MKEVQIARDLACSPRDSSIILVQGTEVSVSLIRGLNGSDYLIVREATRLTRRVERLAEISKLLEEQGIQLVCGNQLVAYQTRTRN